MFKVPYIDLPKQNKKIEREIAEAINKVISNGSFILRDELRRFEENIAGYLGCRYCLALNSGTDALFLSLYSQGFNKGSEVITVSHTFVATIAAIKHCGLKPVLVDIGEDFNIDVSGIERAVTKNTRAIIPVHLNGRICEMDEIKKICVRHNLILIEDACQSLGASYRGRNAGTFGIGCFSLHPMKNLGAAGDGGFVATDSEGLADNIRLLRNHGQKSKEEIAMFGFNSRLDNLQAAILNVKLKHLPEFIRRRREVAGMYHSGLNDLAGLTLPPAPEDKGIFYDVYSSYCVRTDKRDGLFNFLRESGIEVFIHWPTPNHLQEELGLGDLSLLNTEKVSRTVLSLPVYAEIEDDQVEYVIGAVRKFFKKNPK